MTNYNSAIITVGDLEVTFFGIVTKDENGKYFIEEENPILWNAIAHDRCENGIIQDILDDYRDEIEKAIVENKIEQEQEEYYERMEALHSWKDEDRERQLEYRKLK